MVPCACRQAGRACAGRLARAVVDLPDQVRAIKVQPIALVRVRPLGDDRLRPGNGRGLDPRLDREVVVREFQVRIVRGIDVIVCAVKAEASLELPRLKRRGASLQRPVVAVVVSVTVRSTPFMLRLVSTPPAS